MNRGGGQHFGMEKARKTRNGFLSAFACDNKPFAAVILFDQSFNHCGRAGGSSRPVDNLSRLLPSLGEA